MPTRVAPWMLVLLLLAVATAHAQEGSAEPQPPVPASPPATGVAPEPEAAPEPLAFGEALDAAREQALEERKPLLVVCVPDWYESPAWTRLRQGALGPDGKTDALRAFVRVLVRETRDREVHVRHRVAFEGYPLAVVLSADGTYLGHESGLPPRGDDAAWIDRVVAIPARAARIRALRERLDAAPEDAEVLFELGKALAEAGEAERADALFVRMEQADPLAPAERLGEARYLRLRHRVVALLTEKRFGDVEALCLRWRRRFTDHARAPDVLLLQANAQFLAGQKDEARALWKVLVDDHADSGAAARAKKALEDLKD